MTKVVTLNETVSLILSSASDHSHSQYTTMAQVEAIMSQLSTPLDIQINNFQLLPEHIQKTIRMNPTTINNIYLPEGNPTLDGKKFYLALINTGVITVTCSGNDTIGNNTGKVLTIQSNPYAEVTIEWCDPINTWIIHRTGGISVA